MKQSLLNIAVCLVICSSVLAQNALNRIPFTQKNSKYQEPMQVMMECRLENASLAIGQVVTSTTFSNCCRGYITNGTVTLITNNGTAQPTVGGSTAVENQDGFFVNTVTSPTDGGTKNFLFQCNGADIYPKFTFSVQPVVVVLGVEMMFSNWTGASGQWYDTLRIGQAPYNILNFSDGGEVPPKPSINVHTPEGVGLNILIQTNVWYEIMMIYDAPNDYGGVAVFEKSPSGQYTFRGESLNPMASADTPADSIWFTQFDDHGATGGDIRYNNYWMTTNRNDYLLRRFPKY